MVQDIIDENLKDVFSYILDFRGTNEPEFAQELINKLKLLIGEVVDELKDGFENEMQDVVVFLRLNIDKIVKDGLGSDMEIFSSMATNKIMDQIGSSYGMY